MSHIITYLDIDVEFNDFGDILFLYRDEKQYNENLLTVFDAEEIRTLIDKYLDKKGLSEPEDRRPTNEYWRMKL